MPDNQVAPIVTNSQNLPILSVGNRFILAILEHLDFIILILLLLIAAYVIGEFNKKAKKRKK